MKKQKKIVIDINNLKDAPIIRLGSGEVSIGGGYFRISPIPCAHLVFGKLKKKQKIGSQVKSLHDAQAIIEFTSSDSIDVLEGFLKRVREGLAIAQTLAFIEKKKTNKENKRDH